MNVGCTFFVYTGMDENQNDILAHPINTLFLTQNGLLVENRRTNGIFTMVKIPLVAH